MGRQTLAYEGENAFGIIPVELAELLGRGPCQLNYSLYRNAWRIPVGGASKSPAAGSSDETARPQKPQGPLAAFKKRQYDGAVKAYGQRQRRDRTLIEQADKLKKKVALDHQADIA